MRLRKHDKPKVRWGTAQLFLAVRWPCTVATPHSATLPPRWTSRHLFTVQGFLLRYTQTGFTALQNKASYVVPTRRLPFITQWHNTQRHATKERRPQTPTKTTAQHSRYNRSYGTVRHEVGVDSTVHCVHSCTEWHSIHSATLWLCHVQPTRFDVTQDRNRTYNLTMLRARISACTSASFIGNE
jgi:hypothetical protein